MSKTQKNKKLYKQNGGNYIDKLPLQEDKWAKSIVGFITSAYRAVLWKLALIDSLNDTIQIWGQSKLT